MVNDTPRKRAKRERLVARFERDWEVSFDPVPTLKYKNKNFLVRFWLSLIGKKHTVFAMYWFFKYKYLEDSNYPKFTFPLKHDNIPVAGVPFKYELCGLWVIQEDDLKYLYGGPVIDQHGDILVPAEQTKDKLLRWLNLSRAIIGLVAMLILLAVRFLQFKLVWPW